MDRRTQFALTGAAALAALLPLVYVAAVHVGPLHWLDAAVLNGFTNLNSPRVRPIAAEIATLCDPDRFVWFAAALVAVALLRRRPRTAVAVAVVLLGANVATQLLKPALASPRVSPLLADVGQVVPASWPSGHSTASMSIALCAVLVAPARLRPWVASLGAVFAVAVTFSLLTLDWHYPGDVLGGFLMAGLWSLLAVAALSYAEQRWPRRAAVRGAGDRDAADAAGRRPWRSAPASPSARSGSRQPIAAAARADRAPLVPLRDALAPAGVTAAGAALLGAMVLLARPGQVLDYAAQHTAFVFGAGALAAVALSLAAGMGLLTAATGSRPAARAARPGRWRRG